MTWKLRDCLAIGRSGTFDKVFCLKKIKHPFLSELLYGLTWIDSGERVSGVGSFADPMTAENYVKANRELLIERKFEELFLVTE